MYNETLGKMPLLALADLLQHHVLPDALPRAWPACRAAYPTTRMQFADFNMMASIGAFGFGLSQLLFLYVVVIKCMRGKGEKAPAASRGKAPKGWSGRCRRRRRSTPSRRRRS